MLHWYEIFRNLNLTSGIQYYSPLFIVIYLKLKIMTVNCWS